MRNMYREANHDHISVALAVHYAEGVRRGDASHQHIEVPPSTSAAWQSD